MPLYNPSSSGVTSAPALAYKSGLCYPVTPLNSNSGAQNVADRDYIVALTPRADVTVSKLWFCRVVTTAGNTYLGLYNYAGALLTDCAVHSGTTAGFQQISTTAVALTGGQQYWFVINSSAAVVQGDSVTQSDTEVVPYRAQLGYAFDLGVTNPNIGQIAAYKARANAALLSSLTMSGFTADSFVPLAGIVPS